MALASTVNLEANHLMTTKDAAQVLGFSMAASCHVSVLIAADMQELTFDAQMLHTDD